MRFVNFECDENHHDHKSKGQKYCNENEKWLVNEMRKVNVVLKVCQKGDGVVKLIGTVAVIYSAVKGKPKWYIIVKKRKRRVRRN